MGRKKKVSIFKWQLSDQNSLMARPQLEYNNKSTTISTKAFLYWPVMNNDSKLLKLEYSKGNYNHNNI